MFNETGDHFIALIISPYYSVAADAQIKTNCLPKIRAFVTVSHGGGSGKNAGEGTIVPYEIQLNVIP